MISMRVRAVFAIAAMAFGLTLAMPVRAQAGANESAYEMLNMPPVMIFFDMGRKISLVGRRDSQSISVGDIDTFDVCDYGRFCIILSGDKIPIVVPRAGESISIPGMSVTSEEFAFPHSAPCIKTRIVALTGDSTENIYCSRIGIVSITIHSKSNSMDLFLKSLHGLGAPQDAP